MPHRQYALTFKRGTLKPGYTDLTPVTMPKNIVSYWKMERVNQNNTVSTQTDGT